MYTHTHIHIHMCRYICIVVISLHAKNWAAECLQEPTSTHIDIQKMPHLATSTLEHPWTWGAEANMYTIREVDANDKANFILSPNLFEVAKSKGWSLGKAGVTMVDVG